MARRTLVPVVLVALLLAGCGTRTDDAPTADRGPSPAPETTPEDPDGPDREPERVEEVEPGVPGEARPADPARPRDPGQPPPAEPQPAPEGGMNPPREGRYTYSLSGWRESPLEVGRREYREGARAFVDVRAAGGEYTVERHSNDDPSRQTTRLRWEQDRVLLTYLRITFPNVPAFECRPQPPPDILRFPLQAGQSWTARWQGDDCAGSANIRVAGREDVEAAGRTWSTWRIESTIDFRIQGLKGRTEGPAWYAPELGTAVRAESTTRGELRGGRFASEQQTALLSHP